MHVAAIIAKVFKAGNSQALRLPRALALKAKAYEITITPDGFMATDQSLKARRRKALKEFLALPPMHEEWPRP